MLIYVRFLKKMIVFILELKICSNIVSKKSFFTFEFVNVGEIGPNASIKYMYNKSVFSIISSLLFNKCFLIILVIIIASVVFKKEVSALNNATNSNLILFCSCVNSPPSNIL